MRNRVKEFIANGVVKRVTIFENGTTRIDNIRDANFKDIKKYPSVAEFLKRSREVKPEVEEEISLPTPEEKESDDPKQDLKEIVKSIKRGRPPKVVKIEEDAQGE